MKLLLNTNYRDAELMETPGLTKVDMNDHLIRRIYRLSSAVKNLECYSITDWNCEAEFTQHAEDELGDVVPGKGLRTELNELVVTETSFYWQCVAKHSDVVLSTDWTDIDVLPNPYDEEL